MARTLLMTACLVVGCAAGPEQEKGMKLELLTETTKDKDQTLVTANLRNAGTEPVHILLEFMLSRTYGKLTDDGGKALEAHDGSAVRGQRAFGIKPIKTHLLKPGEQVEVGQFYLAPSGPGAGVGDLTWDLKDVKSKTLTLEMIYEVTEDAAKTAKHHKAPDVAVGRWASKPVVLQYQK